MDGRSFFGAVSHWQGLGPGAIRVATGSHCESLPRAIERGDAERPETGVATGSHCEDAERPKQSGRCRSGISFLSEDE